MITRNDYKLQGEYIKCTNELLKEIKRRRNILTDIKNTISRDEEYYINICTIFITEEILKDYYIYSNYFIPQSIEDINLKTGVINFINDIDNNEEFDEEERENIKKVFNKYSYIFYSQVSREILTQLHQNLIKDKKKA